MSFTGWGKKRKPIGEAKRQITQWEAERAKEFERLLRLHDLDFWHCTVAQRSQAGYPDYTIFGDGWLGFVELKATNLETGRRGSVSQAQRRYQRSIERAKSEWRMFCLPDDWDEVDTWLNGHTNKGIWGTKREVRVLLEGEV